MNDRDIGMPPEVWAAAKEPAKVTDQYVFFFGYEGDYPETTFNQWFPAMFTDSSTRPPTTFLTAEQYMMYQKALLMDDGEVAAQILCSRTPKEAKAFGRQVRNFDQALWDSRCEQIVEHANWLKFSQNPTCKMALLNSGQRQILEASPNDKIWGIGFSPSNAEGKEAQWGENKLGKALERVRARLRHE